MALPLAVPLVIMAARMVATRYLVRAAAGTAGKTALQRAAVTGRNIKNAPATNTSLLNRVPVVGNLTRQPKLLGLNPAAAGSGGRLSSALQKVNPSRLTSPLFASGARIAPRNTSIPGSAARILGRRMGGLEKTARAVASPLAFAGRVVSTPRTWMFPAEQFAWGAAAGGAYKGAQRIMRPQPAAARTPYDSPGEDGYNTEIVPAQTPTPPATPAPAPLAPAIPPSAPAIPPSAPAIPPSAPAIPPGGRETTPGIDGQGNVAPVIEQDEQNRNELNANLAAISASYNSTVNEIKRLYKLSETEEEKELLRFQLADLEQQVEAGQEAVRGLYMEKTQNLKLMASQSREQGARSAESMGQLYSGAATDLEALQEARRSTQTERYRGLGIGSSPLDAEYSGLLRATAPIAQGSAQQISDIGSQGLDYLAGLSESMGAARQGELQSLGAARNASIRETYMQSVLDRINSDRTQMNQQIGSVLSSRANSISSAIQKFIDEGGDPTVADIYAQMGILAEDGIPPNQLDAYMKQFMPGVTITPEFRQQYGRWYDAAKMEREFGLRKSEADMTAAESAALRERILALQAQNKSPEEIAAILGLG